MLRADPETELSGLIGQIYDAALDPGLWPAILPELTGYVGGQAAALLAKTLPDATASMFYYCGVSPDYMRAYLDLYWRYDMFGIVESLGFPIGQPIVTDDLIPYDEFRQGKFFREWAAPQGWIDSVWVVIDRSSTGFGFFSVLRNAEAGRVDAGVHRRMALMAPHIRRAVLIGNVIDLARSEAKSFAAAFDRLRAAVFFVDPSGRVQHANAAGRDMLDGGPLRLARGRLAAADDHADQSLKAAYLAAAAGDTALGGSAIAVPLGGQPRHIAHVLPLTAGSRRHAGLGGTAVAAVFVQRQELPRPAAPELIANAYRLTPTELRVLLAVVEVGGVPEIAEALGIAETTVRTHLGRVYEKTELNRQADLVKLVAGFSSPLAG